MLSVARRSQGQVTADSVTSKWFSSFSLLISYPFLPSAQTFRGLLCSSLALGGRCWGGEIFSSKSSSLVAIVHWRGVQLCWLCTDLMPRELLVFQSIAAARFTGRAELGQYSKLGSYCSNWALAEEAVAAEMASSCGFMVLDGH